MTNAGCRTNAERLRGIEGHDHDRAPFSVDDGDRVTQQGVQRRRDLDWTTARENDPREALMDVQHPFETLTLCLEHSIEHGGRHMRECSGLGKSDDGKTQAVSRAEQF